MDFMPFWTAIYLLPSLPAFAFLGQSWMCENLLVDCSEKHCRLVVIDCSEPGRAQNRTIS